MPHVSRTTKELNEMVERVSDEISIRKTLRASKRNVRIRERYALARSLGLPSSEAVEAAHQKVSTIEQMAKGIAREKLERGGDEK